MFIIETQTGKTFTTTGEFKPNMMVGPGGYNAKTWKTEDSAKKVAARWNAIVTKLEGLQ